MNRKTRIHTLLTAKFNPTYMTVEDESKNHHVPKDAETHFKVVLVSQTFVSLPRIARHRLLNQLLQPEFDLGLHALSMHLHTPEEWDNTQALSPSPTCKNGFNN